MLVDMLGTEAMTQAWVAYSNTANDLKDLSNAYKEARTALEIGKIFYAERNVFGYRTLGIGRLLYQLPVSICEMFIQEISEMNHWIPSTERHWRSSVLSLRII